METEQYLQALIDLADYAELEPLLDGALELIVRACNVTTAYVELYTEADDVKTPRYWRGLCCRTDEARAIQELICRGIIGRAIAEGRTLVTSSALTQIQATMCVPIGIRSTIGALYLEGPRERPEFGPDDRKRAEWLAFYMTPCVDRLLPRSPRLPEELKALAKQRVEESLRRHHWNVSDVARELGVTRKFVYSVIGRRKQ